MSLVTVNMKNITQYIIFIFFGISLTICAQEIETQPDFITDRPGASQSSTTAPKGYLHIETGGFYTSFEESNEKEEVFGYNTTLLRYGVLNNFELRVGWNFEEGQTTINGIKSNDVTSGFSPLLVGVKINITEEKAWVPTIGFLAHLFLPLSASNDFRPETTGVNFRFSFEHSLSEKSSIGYNLGAQWGGDSSEVAYIYTLGYGYSITSCLNVFAEVYGDLPEDSTAHHFWDAGLTFLIMNNLQLDASVGRSFTKGQDLLLSAGVSYRIPK